MIKASEARVISRSAGLNKEVLNKIQNIITAVANKGGYIADISSLWVGQPYLDYLEELGYTIIHYKNKSIGIYVEWTKK